MPAPSFHDHFSGVAGHYAAYRPHYPASLFDWLARLVPRGAAVWGYGPLAVEGGAVEEITPPPFQMEECWTLEQLLGYLGTWSATSRCIKATGRDPRGPLAAALTDAWGDPRAPRRVSWPLAVRVGRRRS